MIYIHRAIEDFILKNAGSFPCITLYGPRQVGKSTTADVLFGNRFKEVNLDGLVDRALANQNPALFLDTYGWPLIIDEVQKATPLLSEIKKKIDSQRKLWREEGKKQELMYVLTGSSRFELVKAVTESLAGRSAMLEMTYLDQSEVASLKEKPFTTDIKELLKREADSQAPRRTRNEIFNDIWRGYMPDVIAGNSDRSVYYPSYIDSYIQKDIQSILKPENEIRFRDFMRIMAFRTAQRVVYSDIGNLIGIDANTAKSWISLLVSSGMAILLEPYLPKISKRIVKAPKFYFLDTGLVADLCGWPSGAMIESGAMSGAFFETFAVAEIVKNLRNHGVKTEDHLFYYRDIDQKEVDLLFVDRGEIFPMEIKKSPNPSKPTKNWSVLEKYNQPILPGLVIDTIEKITPINSMAYAFPVSLLGL